MSYQQDWSAVCPKCEVPLTSLDFICGNCGKGRLKASSKFYPIYMGCDNDKCAAAHPTSILNCPKCQAGINTRIMKFSGASGSGMTVLKFVLALVFPPAAAFLQVGATTNFIINIVLTLLGFVPGCIHALWLVMTNKRN